MAIPIWLETFRWPIGTLHVSWITQGGIEVLVGSLVALPIWIEHSRWQIATLHVSWMTQGGIEDSSGH